MKNLLLVLILFLSACATTAAKTNLVCYSSGGSKVSSEASDLPANRYIKQGDLDCVTTNI